ncbi:hypothetical protein LTR64_002660 [Lithohypha guttulata]|uniref:uncharacterized protein n=1 Tax=Lithohypha guttulata TaxID=1690604 RepID=UPI002DDDD475|nr:hypothetical protein LTR51_001115 [Lithohypha guttulata]
MAPPKYDDEMYEQHPVKYWSDTKRKKLAYTDHNHIHDDYPVDKERAIIYRNNELIFSPIPSGWASNAEMMPEKDIGLLADRVFAFVLQTRTFGVLFLTTNRVGVLDEAIKSRLTYTAYYPPLDEKQTQNIWKVNLRLLKERNKELDVDEKAILRFAKRHFRANVETSSTWNGRQIQNAFKVATALADWDDQSINDQQRDGGAKRRSKLLPSHFEIIAHGTHAFDRYLRAAVGYNDAQRAYNEQVRDDEHQFEAHLSLDTHDHSHSLPAEDYRRSAPSLSPMQTYGRPSSNMIPQQSLDPGHGQYALHADVHNTVSRRRSSTHWQAQASHSPQPTNTQARQRRLSSNTHSVPNLQTSSPHVGPYSMSPARRGGLSESYSRDADRDGALDLDSDVDSLESDIDMPKDKHRNVSTQENLKYAQREQDEEWD